MLLLLINQDIHAVNVESRLSHSPPEDYLCRREPQWRAVGSAAAQPRIDVAGKSEAARLWFGRMSSADRRSEGADRPNAGWEN